jgi:DoxX-like protein
MKLIMPAAVLAQQSGLPGPFMKFIGVAETLGAIGLVLPALTGIRPGLTPLAAAGLMTIMIGATATTATTLGTTPALFPLTVGLLSAFVAYARWRLAPPRAAAHSRVLQPAI